MRRPASSGFSLIELVLVLVLLATVAGLVGVNLGAGVGADRLVVASRDLAGTLRLAADRARLSGRRHRVVLELQAGQVVVEEEEDPLERPDEWTALQLAWGRARTFSPPVRFALVTIDPDDEELKIELPPEDVERIELVFDAEGVHVLTGDVVAELDSEPEEAPLIQIDLRGAEETEQLHVRIGTLGAIRVWTPTTMAAYREALEQRGSD